MIPDAEGPGRPSGGTGDRYDAEADLRTIAERILSDAARDLPGVVMSIVRRVRIGSRMLDVSILRHPLDLAATGAAREAARAVHYHAMRYGWDHSVPETDLFQRHYGVNVEIHPSYWGRRQAQTAGLGPSLMSPTAFMRSVSKGDLLMENGEEGSRRAYRVVSTSRGRFVTDDGIGGAARMSWHTPHADCLIVSEDAVRIAKGSEKDPDRHMALIWRRSR